MITKKEFNEMVDKAIDIYNKGFTTTEAFRALKFPEPEEEKKDAIRKYAERKES